MTSPSEIDPQLQALAGRLGQAELIRRLSLEAELCEERGKKQHRGLFALARSFDLYAFVRFCLKASGFWARAHRNYFDIQVEQNEVPIAGLPAAFDGYTVLQLTDLHADLHPDFPARVKAAIAPLDYDLVAITGDFRTCTFSDHSGATDATIELLSEVEAPIYATLGNHDSIEKVPALEAAGLRFLLNEHIRIQRGDASLYLVGIDDPNYYQTHAFARALEGVPEPSAKLLLSHSPQTYAEAAALGIDFLMAGHTHGGQICLPGGRVIMHDGSSPRRVLSGRWEEGELHGYTSRGTGATGLPVRLNCPAEVTLHTLRRV